MNFLVKISFIFYFSFFLQACALNPKVYQVQNKDQQATLLIDAKPNYLQTTTIYSYNINASTSEKIWDGGTSLVFGKDWMLNLTNKKIKINANQPFNFLVLHTEYTHSYCKIYASFIPKANETYYLMAGIRKSPPPKGFLAAMFAADSDTCFVGVKKMQDGNLVPVELKDFKH